MHFATTIAPGVRDVLLTGKVYEAAKRKKGDRFVYDAVVMDAPPTGRITRFLGVNEEVAGLAKVGPVKRQADSIMSMMRSRSTHVHLVTLLEEMPVIPLYFSSQNYLMSRRVRDWQSDRLWTRYYRDVRLATE